MNVVGVSYSQAKGSMNYRGLTLMDHYINFIDILQPHLPVCDSNCPDGTVPPEVEEFWNTLTKADVFVFAIPEMTAHYSSAFKNAMDWLVVKQTFNSGLGQQYPFSNKPVFVLTFTPVGEGAGDRHFDMTRHLLEKMGANVIERYVKHNGWDEVVPNNYTYVEKESKEILSVEIPDIEVKEETMSHKVSSWQSRYKEWSDKWN